MFTISLNERETKVGNGGERELKEEKCFLEVNVSINVFDFKILHMNQ